MVRRRLTLKRIDPWSVLKFGFVANLSLLAIGMLGFAVVWFFVERLRLIDQVCEIAIEMGFSACGINGGNLFRALFLLGLLGVVIQTGLMVFFAFLFNLIADLVGGLTFSFVDETPGAAARGDVPASSGRTAGTVTGARPAPTVAGERTGPPPPLGTEADRPRGPAPTSSSGSTGNPSRSPQASSPPPASPAPSPASPASSPASPSSSPASAPRDERAGSGGAPGTDRDAGSSERMWNDTQAVRRDPEDR